MISDDGPTIYDLFLTVEVCLINNVSIIYYICTPCLAYILGCITFNLSILYDCNMLITYLLAQNLNTFAAQDL